MSLFARLFRKEKEIESKIEPLIPLVQQDVVSEEPQAEEPAEDFWNMDCLLYTSPSPRDATLSRMPSSA